MQTKGAFTIIELLIVITILALLTTLATTSYLTAQVRSRDSARKATVNTIAGAVEAFYSVQRSFPGDSYVKDQQQVPTNNTFHTCETVDYFGAGYMPYYYFKPNVDCGAGTESPAVSGPNPQFAYKPTDFSPPGTWIPGLGKFLNPFPTENRFVNHSGTSASIAGNDTTDPYELLSDATNHNQATDPSRSILYRNMSSGYTVYARLESQQDSDFATQFSDRTSKPDYVCLPNLLGAVQLPIHLSCLPAEVNGVFPVIVYLVRK